MFCLSFPFILFPHFSFTCTFLWSKKKRKIFFFREKKKTWQESWSLLDFVIATKVEFENNANIFVWRKLRFNDVNVKYKFNGNDAGKLYSNYFRELVEIRDLLIEVFFFLFSKIQHQYFKVELRVYSWYNGYIKVWYNKHLDRKLNGKGLSVLLSLLSLTTTSWGLMAKLLQKKFISGKDTHNKILTAQLNVAFY